MSNTYDGKVIDEVFDVENDDAIRTGREVAQQEGLNGASLPEPLSLQQPRLPSARKTRERRLWCCCPTPVKGI